MAAAHKFQLRSNEAQEIIVLQRHGINENWGKVDKAKLTTVGRKQ